MLMSESQLLAQHGEFDRAYAKLGLAERLDPGKSIYLSQMGWIRYQQGDLNSAMRCLQQALSADPKDLSANNNLGLIHLRNGHHAEARRCFERAIEIGPMPVHYYNLARAHAQTGNPAAAMEALSSACQGEKSFMEKAANETDFEALRDIPSFRRLVLTGN